VATDPVCPKSPHRPLIDSMLGQAAGVEVHPVKFMPRTRQDTGLRFRNDENSRRLGAQGGDACAAA
jgi:pyrroloquinoline quinone biosynthesis protein E